MIAETRPHCRSCARVSIGRAYALAAAGLAVTIAAHVILGW